MTRDNKGRFVKKQSKTIVVPTGFPFVTLKPSGFTNPALLLSRQDDARDVERLSQYVAPADTDLAIEDRAAKRSSILYSVLTFGFIAACAAPILIKFFH